MTNAWAWMQSNKTYIISGVGVIKLIYVAAFGHPWSDAWDAAINGILLLLFGAAVRSAMTTHTAQIVNAIVSPGGPKAEKLAASAPPADPIPTKTEVT